MHALRVTVAARLARTTRRRAALGARHARASRCSPRPRARVELLAYFRATRPGASSRGRSTALPGAPRRGRAPCPRSTGWRASARASAPSTPARSGSCPPGTRPPARRPSAADRAIPGRPSAPAPTRRTRLCLAALEDARRARGRSAACSTWAPGTRHPGRGRGPPRRRAASSASTSTPRRSAAARRHARLNARRRSTSSAATAARAVRPRRLRPRARQPHGAAPDRARRASSPALRARAARLVLSGLLREDVRRGARAPTPACGRARREHRTASGPRSSFERAAHERSPASTCPRPRRARASTLPEHSAHHAREVLRLRAGAAVRVFDGAGARVRGRARRGRRAARRRARLARAGRSRGPSRRCSSCLALLAAQGRPHGAGDPEGHRARRGRDPARGHRPHRRRRPARPQGLAPGALGEGGQRRRRAVRPRGRAATSRPTVTLAALLAERPFGRTRAAAARRPPGQPPLPSLAIDPRLPSLLLLVGPAGGWEPREVATRSRAAGFQRRVAWARASCARRRRPSPRSSIAQALWGDLGRLAGPEPLTSARHRVAIIIG